MSEVRVFRVTGKIMKPNLKTAFKREVRAVKPEDAREKILTELGSKHRAKRFQIKIFNVQEISIEEIENPLIKKLSVKEETDVQE
jgi:large subunit ribosomal protein LX